MSEIAPLLLLADSDTNIRRSVSTILEATGYKVVSAVDFESGQKLLEKRSFALAVVAARFDKGPSGFALIRAFRAAEIPVLVLLGEESFDDTRDAFRLGAEDILLKPLRPSELICSVRRALGEAPPLVVEAGLPEELVREPVGAAS